MEESQKEAASTAKSQKKSSLLAVEEIEKDFLSSWKSMSVTEDDALDFNCETVSKGRNKTFNFDKLDMDFSLDGDFGKKLSSFKVDMSDLDFSSPPKKLGTTKERTGKESILGKNEGKQDHFTFAFDFDELGSFDLDSSLMKGEKKSDKFTDDKGFDSQGKHDKNQSSRSNASPAVDVFEDGTTNKAPILEHVDTSKFQSLIGGLGNLASKSDGSPHTLANSGNLKGSVGVTVSSEKERTTSGKRTDHCSQQSERTVSTEPNVHEAIQNSSIRSGSSDDSIQETIPELQVEVCSFGTEVNTNSGLEQDISVKSIAGLNYNLDHSHNLERAPPTSIAGSKSSNNEFEKLENQNGVPMGDTNENDSVQDYTDIEDASITSVSQKMLNDTKPKKEDTTISKLSQAALHSDTKSYSFVHRKEKDSGSILPNFLNISEEKESLLNTASTPKKDYSLSKRRIETVSSDERRLELNSSDAQARNQKIDTSKSLDGALTKGAAVILGTEKNDKNQITSCSQVQSASLPSQTTKSSTPKCINTRLISSSAPIMNSRSVSVERNKISLLKSENKTLDITCLNVSRPITSKKNLSHSSVHAEVNLLRHSKGSREMHADTTSKMVNAVGAEKQGLLSPSMKRKTFEAPNADPVALYPLKLVTESPSESRRAVEAPERVENKRVRNTENLLDSCHSISTHDVPRDACVGELEIPLLMENDGNVEKAEACAKELEDICNMLKKKHEEAKEILVHAIVNNNNLLMLNHPMYAEKIRMVQRFATRLMSREV